MRFAWLVCVPTIASAEPTSFVRASAALGNEAAEFPAAVIALEAGTRVSNAYWLRAELAYGRGVVIDEGAGTFAQARVGFENRTCAPWGHSCYLWSIDLGYHRARWYDDSEEHERFDALVATPRAAIELGGGHLRALLAVEIDYDLIVHRVDIIDDTVNEDRWSTTGPLPVAFRFGGGFAYLW